MKWIRGLFFLAAVAMLVYGLFIQAWELHSLQEEASHPIRGTGFTDMAARDAILRRGTRLYDGLSLTPAFDQTDDCAT